MNGLVDFSIRKYVYVLLSILFLTMVVSSAFVKLDFNNNIDIFFEKDDPGLKQYLEFQSVYGNEELALIVVKADEIFSNTTLSVIRNISDTLKETEGVKKVFSLTEHEEAVTEDDILIFKNLIPDKRFSKEELSLLKSKVLGMDIVTDRLISKGGKLAALLVELEQTNSSSEKTALMLTIKKKANQVATEGIDLHFSGMPYFETEVNLLTISDLMILVPLSSIIIFCIVYLLLRSLILSALAMTNIGIILLLTLGCFLICGESLNMVTFMLPMILLAISVANSIHILSHFIQKYNTGTVGYILSIKETISSLWVPCLFTSLTTAIGFLSFVTSNVRPIKVLGMFTAFGIMLAFMLSVTFLPAALTFMQKKVEKKKIKDSKANEVNSREPQSGSTIRSVTMYLGNASIQHNIVVSLLVFLILVISVFGIYRLQYETNIIRYIPEKNRTIKDLAFIEKNFGGIFTNEILIRSMNESIDFSSPESLAMVNDIQSTLMKDLWFSSSVSIVDYIKDMHRDMNDDDPDYFHIPKHQETILDYYEISDPEYIDRLTSPDRKEARISLLSHTISNEDVKKHIDAHSAYLTEKTGSEYSFYITGQPHLWIDMVANLKHSLMKSFSTAFVIIFIMLLWICRDFKLAMVTIVPNLMPICFTLGIMGWFGIPLDTITVMIASVTLGIAIDDTIHFIVWYKRSRLNKLDNKDAILMTLKHIGVPITITSMVLVFGFLVLLIGSMNPVKLFGALTAFSIIIALIGDVAFLPALISLFFKKKKLSATST